MASWWHLCLIVVVCSSTFVGHPVSAQSFQTQESFATTEANPATIAALPNDTLQTELPSSKNSSLPWTSVSANTEEGTITNPQETWSPLTQETKDAEVTTRVPFSGPPIVELLSDATALTTDMPWTIVSESREQAIENTFSGVTSFPVDAHTSNPVTGHLPEIQITSQESSETFPGLPTESTNVFGIIADNTISTEVVNQGETDRSTQVTETIPELTQVTEFGTRDTIQPTEVTGLFPEIITTATGVIGDYATRGTAPATDATGFSPGAETTSAGSSVQFPEDATRPTETTKCIMTDDTTVPPTEATGLSHEVETTSAGSSVQFPEDATRPTGVKKFMTDDTTVPPTEATGLSHETETSAGSSVQFPEDATRPTETTKCLTGDTTVPPTEATGLSHEVETTSAGSNGQFSESESVTMLTEVTEPATGHATETHPPEASRFPSENETSTLGVTEYFTENLTYPTGTPIQSSEDISASTAVMSTEDNMTQLTGFKETVPPRNPFTDVTHPMGMSTDTNRQADVSVSASFTTGNSTSPVVSNSIQALSSDESGNKLNGGQIAAIVIFSVLGGVALIAGLVALFVIWRRRQRQSQYNVADSYEMM